MCRSAPPPTPTPCSAGPRRPWGAVDGLGADAVTLNPLLGEDSLEPLVDAAAAAGAGIFVLVRTSNPGAADFLDAGAGGGRCTSGSPGVVAGLADRLAGSGAFSGAGAVVGATEPRFLDRLRELMPRAIFLLPGVGAQGGSADGSAAAFAGPGSALVTASRSVASAPRPGRRRRGAAGPGLVDRRRLSPRP